MKFITLVSFIILLLCNISTWKSLDFAGYLLQFETEQSFIEPINSSEFEAEPFLLLSDNIMVIERLSRFANWLLVIVIIRTTQFVSTQSIRAPPNF